MAYPLHGQNWPNLSITVFSQYIMYVAGRCCWEHRPEVVIVAVVITLLACKTSCVVWGTWRCMAGGTRDAKKRRANVITKSAVAAATKRHRRRSTHLSSPHSHTVVCGLAAGARSCIRAPTTTTYPPSLHPCLTHPAHASRVCPRARGAPRSLGDCLLQPQQNGERARLLRPAHR